MQEISSTIWQRKGSSVVFHQESLGPLISAGSLVSLRTALGWIPEWPSDPPVPARTVLVSGLETILETMEPGEAEEFLSKRVRPLILEFQHQWNEHGLVFGFSKHEKAFEINQVNEEVLYRRQDRQVIRLSESLWDGSSTLNLSRIVDEGDEPGNAEIVGYHVARIS